jgi:hypothetical protein
MARQISGERVCGHSPLTRSGQFVEVWARLHYALARILQIPPLRGSVLRHVALWLPTAALLRGRLSPRS